jgi:hypothetical protein
VAWIPIKWCSPFWIIDVWVACLVAIEEFWILRSANSFNYVITSRIETDLWSSIDFKFPNKPFTGLVTKYREKYLTIDNNQCIVWSKGSCSSLIDVCDPANSFNKYEFGKINFRFA